jgi:hypothetical protein
VRPRSIRCALMGGVTKNQRTGGSDVQMDGLLG